MGKPEELKPCPFCGGSPFVATVEHSEENRPRGWRFHGRILCKSCQASAGTTGFDQTYEEATAKAVKAWNNRQHNRLLLDVARASKRMRSAVNLYFRHINSPVAIGWDELLDAIAEYDAALSRAREAGIKLEEVSQCHTTPAKNAET